MWNELVYKLLRSVEAEYVSTGIRKEHSLAKDKQLNGGRIIFNQSDMVPWSQLSFHWNKTFYHHGRAQSSCIYLFLEG